MTASPTELVALRTVATHLGPLREQVVFVGGMIRSLLISDPAAPPARPTDDIDVIADIASRAAYYAIADQLRNLGFREDQSDGAPLCRWIVAGLKVDVMPDHANVLGFSNRWYPSARVAIVDGREELLEELKSCREPVRAFIATEVHSLTSEDDFAEALPGHLAGDKASQARLGILEKRLRAIAALRT